MHCAPTIILIVLLVLPLHAQDFAPPIVGEYIATTDALGESVIVYDTDTGVSHAISIGLGAHQVWDTSPDGCELLVTLTPEAAPTLLYAVTLDGNARPLLNVDDLPNGVFGNWSAWEPDWSPDGTRIAFTLSRPIESPESYTGVESRVAWVPPQGGAPTFYSVAGDEFYPTWSPDGAWLAYVSYEVRPAGATLYATAEPNIPADTPAVRESDLWKVSADGLTKERLTTFYVGSVTHPRWNPDSTLIAFLYTVVPSEDFLWIIAAQPNAIPTRLTTEPVQSQWVIWQPDGLALLAALRGFQADDAARLWSVPPLENAEQSAARYPLTAADDAAFDFPLWNANGGRLAVRRDYTLTILAPDAAPTVLAGLGNTPPVWSPAAFGGQATCGG